MEYWGGAPAEAGGAKRLLLVEDERIVSLAEGAVLRKCGYSVEIADSGEAALSLLEGGSVPDLILMDIDLGPGIDGTVAASLILKRWKLPIVFLTSHSSKEMVERVRGITRYGFIVKNSGDFVMLSSIEMAFDLFDKERAVEERDLLLQRAERVARIGYWFILPGASAITLSEGSRAILGIETKSCSFEDFQRQVLAGTSDARLEAFRALVEKGEPYDITYKIRRGDTGEIVTLRSSGRACDNAIVGVLQDISEIGRLLGVLRESEERQAVTLRSIGDGVISTDVGGRVVELNGMAESLTGWKSTEASGRPISEVFEIVNAVTRKPVENPVQKVIETGYVVGLANHTVLIARDGAERHIADSAAPIRAEDGSLFGMVLVFRDVTRDYEARELLERNEALFRTLFTDSHAPMLLIDPEGGKIEEANRASEKFYGWPRERLRAMNISDINTLGPEEIARDMSAAAGADHAEFRFLHRTATGEARHVLVSSGPIRVGGKNLLLSLVSDATDAHEREIERIAERDRSSLLLRDAHHRVKNDAQMISSLIQLQLTTARDEEVVSALRELQSRALSMTLVYDQLHGGDDGRTLSSSLYFRSLLESIGASYLPGSVKMRERIQDIALECRFATSMGIIVGELVLNACKYAFPPGRGGTIGIEFARDESGALSLVVSDDGIGVEASRARQGPSVRGGVGLDLVRSLVAQEKGALEMASGGEGTVISIRFPMGGP